MQQRTPIEEQIDLPFVESLRISFQSLKIRFGRSVITTAGITLGIAFLVSVWTNNESVSRYRRADDNQQLTLLKRQRNKAFPQKIYGLLLCP